VDLSIPNTIKGLTNKFNIAQMEIKVLSQLSTAAGETREKMAMLEAESSSNNAVQRELNEACEAYEELNRDLSSVKERLQAGKRSRSEKPLVCKHSDTEGVVLGRKDVGESTSLVGRTDVGELSSSFRSLSC
jgi:hypothetical protein